MSADAFIGMIENAALLLALGGVYALIPRKPQPGTDLRRVLIGLAIGLIGVALIGNSWELTPGLIFDSRSVLLSVAGLFFGWLPALTGAILVALFRVHVGGFGTVMGVAVIGSSVGIGLLWRYFRDSARPLGWLELILFALAVHVGMLLCAFILPSGFAIETIERTALPVLTVLPLGTVLLGRLLERERTRREVEALLVRNEAQLQALTQRLQLATESARIGIWELDLETSKLIWDDRMFEIYGQQPNSSEDTYAIWKRALHPDDQEAVLKKGDEAASSGGSFKTRFRIVRPSGDVRHVEAHATVARSPSGKARRLIGINVDITDQVRAQHERARIEAQLRQAQKMEAVGQLAGGIAHDFNNMLSVILNTAEMAMVKVPETDSLHYDLGEILHAAERSADLTRQLLAFSRKQLTEPRIINLNEVVAKQRTMLGRLISEEISIDFRAGSPVWDIRIDPSQLDQVLANLVVNARDAIEGTGTVLIETGNVVLDESHGTEDMPLLAGDYVMLSISDDGVGMDRETLERIFEPFFTTKALGKGTGLGLATVYGVVKQNRGSIHVYSEPGIGSTVKLYFPRWIATPAEREVETKRSVTCPEASGTVLVVEDEPQILTIVKRGLEREGFRVLTATTPAEAGRLVKGMKDDLQLLLTDVVMPGMNGSDLQQRLQDIKPGFRTLFMSGYAADLIAERGVLEKGVHFIQKPFSMNALIEKVRGILSENGGEQTRAG